MKMMFLGKLNIECLFYYLEETKKYLHSLIQIFQFFKKLRCFCTLTKNDLERSETRTGSLK